MSKLIGIIIFSFSLAFGLSGCALRKELLEITCTNQKTQYAVPPVLQYKGSLIYYDTDGKLKVEEKKNCGVK